MVDAVKLSKMSDAKLRSEIDKLEGQLSVINKSFIQRGWGLRKLGDILREETTDPDVAKYRSISTEVQIMRDHQHSRERMGSKWARRPENIKWI